MLVRRGPGGGDGGVVKRAHGHRHFQMLKMLPQVDLPCCTGNA